MPDKKVKKARKESTPTMRKLNNIEKEIQMWKHLMQDALKQIKMTAQEKNETIRMQRKEIRDWNDKPFLQKLKQGFKLKYHPDPEYGI